MFFYILHVTYLYGDSASFLSIFIQSIMAKLLGQPYFKVASEEVSSPTIAFDPREAGYREAFSPRVAFDLMEASNLVKD